ncbi:MAG: ferric reductase-like transmembrane domain-containing protein [Pseudomonadota bacterium]
MIPVAAALNSPLLQWREPIYIAAGFAGVVGMALIFLQPLLAARWMPGMTSATSRKLHRILGLLLVLAVFIHVAGLWVTSPPDVMDALTFRSPTPFAVWGVLAMWAIFAAAGLVLYRKRVPPKIWRPLHTSLVMIATIGTVVHAVLIDGTMEVFSKWILGLACLSVLAAATYRLRSWAILTKRKPHAQTK